MLSRSLVLPLPSHSNKKYILEEKATFKMEEGHICQKVLYIEMEKWYSHGKMFWLKKIFFYRKFLENWTQNKTWVEIKILHEHCPCERHGLEYMIFLFDLSRSHRWDTFTDFWSKFIFVVNFNYFSGCDSDPRIHQFPP